MISNSLSELPCRTKQKEHNIFATTSKFKNVETTIEFWDLVASFLMLVPFMLNGKLSQEFPLNTGNPQNHGLGSAPYDISIPFKNYNNLHYSCDFER